MFFAGIQNGLKIFVIVPASHAAAYAKFLWKFLYLGNWAWDFLGGEVLVQGFFWDLTGLAPGFDFCPHSIIPVT